MVLKGAGTVVAGPDGRLAVNPTGNPGMATGGTGDVLTGIITGLLAQGVTPWGAACAGVYVHGLAGDLAASELGETGLIAGDVIRAIPLAIRRILEEMVEDPLSELILQGQIHPGEAARVVLEDGELQVKVAQKTR